MFVRDPTVFFVRSQGRMSGNPYSSKEPGLGPLMRDIKNRICTDCELVALLEDDSGMELLVSRWSFHYCRRERHIDSLTFGF